MNDSTSLGSILVQMGMITEEQLAEIVQLQDRASIDLLIGRLAIAEALITPDQLEEALSAQAGLRSKSRSRRALAQVKIVELSAVVIKRTATSLKVQAVAMRRARASGGYAAAGGAAVLLAKNND